MPKKKSSKMSKGMKIARITNNQHLSHLGELLPQSDVISNSPVPTIPSAPPRGYGKAVNDYLHQHITIADAKAAAFFAGNLVGVTILFNRSNTGLMSNWLNLLTLGLLTVSTILSGVVLFPRTKTDKKGTIYWENILNFNSYDAYIARLQELNEHDVEIEYATQNFVISKILRRKHAILRWSIALSFAGVLLLYAMQWLS